jgi:hypothetical protein
MFTYNVYIQCSFNLTSESTLPHEKTQHRQRGIGSTAFWHTCVKCTAYCTVYLVSYIVSNIITRPSFQVIKPGATYYASREVNGNPHTGVVYIGREVFISILPFEDNKQSNGTVKAFVQNSDGTRVPLQIHPSDLRFDAPDYRDGKTARWTRPFPELCVVSLHGTSFTP